MIRSVVPGSDKNGVEDGKYLLTVGLGQAYLNKFGPGVNKLMSHDQSAAVDCQPVAAIMLFRTKPEKTHRSTCVNNEFFTVRF